MNTETLTATISSAERIEGAGLHVLGVLTLPGAFALIVANWLIVTGIIYPLAKRNPQLARMKLGLHLALGGVCGLIPGIFPADWPLMNCGLYGVIAGGVAYIAPSLARSILPRKAQATLDQIEGTQDLRAISAEDAAKARADASRRRS